MTKPKRPELNGTQLQRAIENAGGLWTVVELRKLGIIRWGDQLTDVPSVMIAPLEPQDHSVEVDLAPARGPGRVAAYVADAVSPPAKVSEPLEVFVIQ